VPYLCQPGSQTTIIQGVAGLLRRLVKDVPQQAVVGFGEGTAVLFAATGTSGRHGTGIGHKLRCATSPGPHKTPTPHTLQQGVAVRLGSGAFFDGTRVVLTGEHLRFCVDQAMEMVRHLDETWR
jgi:hypothetical protein